MQLLFFIGLSILFIAQILSDTSQMEFDDAVELLQLQEKANQLLLRGYEYKQITFMINVIW